MTNQQARTKSGKSGFTLIELSIVLVIIGLIVGGVLVGQDLIKAAEIRATIGQLEKYDAAVNTFRGKYNGLPGDLRGAANFGFVAALNSNGDGFINSDISIGADATDNGTEFSEEAAAFFSHMADANLISESIPAFATNTTTKTTDYNDAHITIPSNFMPVSKLGRGTLVAVRGAAGQNYFFLGVPTSPMATAGLVAYANTAQIPVIDAFQIDGKLDDNNPTTGRVVSAARAGASFTALDAGNPTAADDHCKITNNAGDSDDVYNTGTTARANDTLCLLRIRASF